MPSETIILLISNIVICITTILTFFKTKETHLAVNSSMEKWNQETRITARELGISEERARRELAIAAEMSKEELRKLAKEVAQELIEEARRVSITKETI
jgi:DnaJ-domain-containing protein 1